MNTILHLFLKVNNFFYFFLSFFYHFSICQYLTQKFIIRLVQHTIFKMRRIPIILLYKQPFFFYNNLVAASEKSFFYRTALQIFQINGGILQ